MSDELPAGLSGEEKPKAQPLQGFSPVMTLMQVEREHISFALQVFHDHHTKCARALGISRSTLTRKIKFYDLEDKRGQRG